MHIGSELQLPRMRSAITGHDSIYLSALGEDSGPTPFPADLAQAITAEFAGYRAAAPAIGSTPSQVQTLVNGWTQWQRNPTFFNVVKLAENSLPAWFKTPAAFADVSQGANGATGYVSFRVVNRNGTRIWEVPASYKLNEGTQTITPAMAAAAGGFATPVGPTYFQRTTGGGSRGQSWLFLQDPRPYLPVGQIGAGYVGGVSGKSITMQAVKGVAMVVLPVVAGVIAAPLIFGAAGGAGAGAGAAAGAITGGAGAGAGTAAGAAAAETAASAGLTAGGVTAATGAGIAAPALITSASTGAGSALAPVAAAAAPAAASSGGFFPGILAAGKTAAGVLSTAMGVQKALAAGKGKSAVPAGTFAPDQGGSGYGGGVPEGGGDFFSQSIAGVPLWLLIVGGGVVAVLATRKRK